MPSRLGLGGGDREEKGAGGIEGAELGSGAVRRCLQTQQGGHLKTSQQLWSPGQDQARQHPRVGMGGAYEDPPLSKERFQQMAVRGDMWPPVGCSCPSE